MEAHQNGRMADSLQLVDEGIMIVRHPSNTGCLKKSSPAGFCFVVRELLISMGVGFAA